MPQAQPVAPADSPERVLASGEQSFGEKFHDGFFKVFINFLVNLFASGVFSFWVAHSRNPIKLPFIAKEIEPLSVLQSRATRWLSEQPIMNGLKDQTTKIERAQSMVGLFTLLMPGHFVMIPSLWLGSKFKPQIVKTLNEWKYGRETVEQSPELQARQAALECEERPTLFGALVARAGTVLATQAVARTIGSPNNWANALGEKTNIGVLKRFGGMDPLAGKIGDQIGNGIERVTPGLAKPFNRYFSTHGYEWAEWQTRANPSLAGTPYDKAASNLSRYITMDVLYTFITAVTLHPILNFVKQYIPGIKQRSVPAVRSPASAAQPQGSLLRHSPCRDQEPSPQEDVPAATFAVDSARHDGRIAPAPQLIREGV